MCFSQSTKVFHSDQAQKHVLRCGLYSKSMIWNYLQGARMSEL